MDGSGEGKLFARFEKHAEFADIQQSLLALDLTVVPTAEESKEEIVLLQKLSDILDEYQEQSYLLDPYFEGLVVPVVDSLKSHANVSISDCSIVFSSERVQRVALLLYRYIKCRGYKTITRFLPHEIADLSIALTYMQNANSLVVEVDQWALRYTFLLWLSLICMLPFDLAQFDVVEGGNHTALSIEHIGKEFLSKAGLEREGAAIMLSRLYMRKDTLTIFRLYLSWCKETIRESKNPFTVIGLLQVLCEVLKSGSVGQIEMALPDVLAIAATVEGESALFANTVVRKYKTKLVSRVALRILPARSAGGTDSQDSIEVPDSIEVMLEQLFQSLQDKDTIVRWSAAKGIARISDRLPTDFADQVLDTIMGLFSIHSVVAASIYDLPAIAESTWHGSSLACAEMARRGLISSERLPELLNWLSKALYFDLRKGAHSIGSNVRDAAAYVFWALARSKNPNELAPHAEELARQLVTVSLYDREIHIRRAASAAFQEHVGRTGLFPHGIDVLRKTDFYAVGIRRNAFLVAAPQVADHPEYRRYLFDHVLDVPLRHWDVNLRQLASQSLRLICLLDLSGLGPQVCSRAAKLLESPDGTDIHGGLLALTELSIACRDRASSEVEREQQMRDIFKYLAIVPHAVLVGSRNETVTAAACHLIASTVTLTEISMGPNTSVPKWRQVVDFGLKHRRVSVQEAAAMAMASISKLVDCFATVTRLIRELRFGSFSSQQSLGRVLGVIDYDSFPKCLPDSIGCLLECARPSRDAFSTNVEARRNCYLAIPQIVQNVLLHLNDHMSPEVFTSLFDALLGGLEDYTIDERGDVGSWIRMACVRGLTSVSEILISNASTINRFDDYLPPSKYHLAVIGILKQGVERLDNVRQDAGECILRLLRLPVPDVKDSERWQLPSCGLLVELFASGTESVGWSDGYWLFPRAVRLLEIEEYRQPVLTGLIMSLGSKTDNIHRPVSTSLSTYARSLPASGPTEAYDLVTLANDLIKYAKANISSNNIIVPVLQTVNVLLEAGALEKLSSDDSGIKSLDSLHLMASRHIDRLKSVQRIHESMKIVVNLLAFDVMFERCITSLPSFLAHRFPTIRSDAAELLYLKVQSMDLNKDTEEVEELLLETEWSSSDIKAVCEKAQHIVESFKGEI
ncbi:TBCD protein [Guyanagaster necrorhizus]|uniref:TBCD protein n=1 Tax=Guyanagaster necrorhizus TaxID=856835 RepID=A0A9P7VM80_9AGAR|nr:TBCD protein [Guyanagaster necrorhizus MCA 3950]KAG7443080.1 TBCD protein [Guyanagaster necrorhizus MCA 3950]